MTDEELLEALFGRRIAKKVRAFVAERNAITADEFEREYAERSGVTVEFLHFHGRYAEPCDCGVFGLCEGWSLGHQHEDALFDDARRDDPLLRFP